MLTYRCHEEKSSNLGFRPSFRFLPKYEGMQKQCSKCKCYSPLTVVDCPDDGSEDEGPALPQRLPIVVEDLQRALQLLLPDVALRDGGQLLQGGQQHRLQALKCGVGLYTQFTRNNGNCQKMHDII